MTESGYSPAHAAFYDVVTGAQDREDTPFYVDRAREADGPVLELACGTGRVYLELLRAGVDADGLDSSAGALDVLRERASDEGFDPTVWQANMADFAVDREYALVICPFNAVQHLLSVDAQRSLLASAYDALAPGGAFVFDVFVPSFDVICETYGEWRTTEREHEGESYEVRTRSRVVDEVEQQFEVTNRVSDPTGEQVLDESFRLKLLPKREVELLARLSPFESWDVAGGFDGAPIEDGDTTQVWTLHREA